MHRALARGLIVTANFSMLVITAAMALDDRSPWSKLCREAIVNFTGCVMNSTNPNYWGPDGCLESLHSGPCPGFLGVLHDAIFGQAVKDLRKAGPSDDEEMMRYYDGRYYDGTYEP